MLISYMTKMMMMFSGIIVVGLFLTWVNDGLEHFLSRFRPTHQSPANTFKALTSDYSVVAKQFDSINYLPASRPPVTALLAPVQPKTAEKLVVFKSVAESVQHDYAGKIVKIDLAPRSRATQDENGEKLGEHVTVLPKAA